MVCLFDIWTFIVYDIRVNKQWVIIVYYDSTQYRYVMHGILYKDADGLCTVHRKVYLSIRKYVYL